MYCNKVIMGKNDSQNHNGKGFLILKNFKYNDPLMSGTTSHGVTGAWITMC